jgi:sterol carrier protein 2
MVKNANEPVYVRGVGMTKFIKPRRKVDYPELGFEAGVKAMLDAHVNYDDVDQGIACYCYGDSTCGQRVFYQFGMTQIPIYNVNNNCSTGSTGLSLARNMIGHGAANCVLVVGFEKMFPGSLQSLFQDRANPLDRTNDMMAATRGITNAPTTAQMFGNAGREYMEKWRSQFPYQHDFYTHLLTKIRKGMVQNLRTSLRSLALITNILSTIHTLSSAMFTL